jgi:mRNA interferase YafQ
MLFIVYTNKMKRDAKRMAKRGKNLSKLTDTLNLLASGTGTHSDLFDE